MKQTRQNRARATERSTMATTTTTMTATTATVATTTTRARGRAGARGRVVARRVRGSRFFLCFALDARRRGERRETTREATDETRPRCGFRYRA